MDAAHTDLYEFLVESELQQYYNAIKNELKVTNAAQFKYATDEDLKAIGLSRPEIRRLRRFYEKHFPHGYLSKIKRLLQAPGVIAKRDDNAGAGTNNGTSPARAPPNNKHIIPADALAVNKQLGIGEFGVVQQGVWTNGTERTQVAVKSVCRERMQTNPIEFLREAAIMHAIEHENIVRLYGVALDANTLMIVTELAHLRSLLECLKDAGLRASFLHVHTLCEFALQICNGMRYLEQQRLVHRDLAARNILVFSKHKIKISDFGLSRALGIGADYYKTNLSANLKLPMAWCAPECISFLRFTTASDVWAYAVCLWEMFSYGFQPWAALTGMQILEAIDAPNYQRLERPDCCPQEYYALMLKCWQDDAARRPNFEQIYAQLPDMKPEQLKAVANCLESKKEHLSYKQGDIITVLDRRKGTQLWKGALLNGKTGYFNPSNTVAFLAAVPSMNKDLAFGGRTAEHRLSKRKLRTEMISKPQNDLKHTGHIGIDGMSFGNVAFMAGTQNCNETPKQLIVASHTATEEHNIEHTGQSAYSTPTTPDSFQTASSIFFEGSQNSAAMTPTFAQSCQSGQRTSTNPFRQRCVGESFATTARMNDNPPDDDDIGADHLDFGPSLMDEINSMFGSITTSTYQEKTPDTGDADLKNDYSQFAARLANKSSERKHRLGGNLRPKEEKALNQPTKEATDGASTKSMLDLVSEHSAIRQSPKRKFDIRLPQAGTNDTPVANGQQNGGSTSSAHNKDAQSATDLQLQFYS